METGTSCPTYLFPAIIIIPEEKGQEPARREGAMLKQSSSFPSELRSTAVAPTGLGDAYQVSHWQRGSPTAVNLNDRAASFCPFTDCNVVSSVGMGEAEDLNSACGALSALCHMCLCLRDFWGVTQTLERPTTQWIQTWLSHLLCTQLRVDESRNYSVWYCKMGKY